MQMRLSGALRRGTEIVMAALIGVALLPFMAAISAAIAFGMGTPVIFRHRRAGHLQQPFTLYKFRTMSSQTGPDGRLLPDSRRLTPIGRFLRKTSLDELPQLWNVLRGEMSLVGPRPCLPYEYDRYLPWQKERFNTLPGLTGLWQVSGKNRTTFVEMIQLDIHYARNKTFWLDFKIILKTIPALIGQMRDIWKKQKSLSRPVPAKPAIPVLAASSHSMPPTAFTTSTRANGNALTQKETWSKLKVGG